MYAIRLDRGELDRIARHACPPGALLIDWELMCRDGHWPMLRITFRHHGTGPRRVTWKTTREET
jgi:hypothetical protein